MEPQRVALVTGASRGIGKVCAIYLARAGYDVAITARSVHEGEQREHSPTVKDSKTSPLPGSLLATAALIEAESRRALPVAADLLDLMSLGACVATVLERWGRVDVVVHNGRYIGPGHMDVLLDTPVELIEKQLRANAIAPLHITKMILPGMIARGSGVIIDITSAVAYCDPTKPIGKGGWGLGYAMSKGAFHRVAGILAMELENTGVSVFNVQPGFIATERMAADMAGLGFSTANAGEPPDVVAAVVSWLVTNPAADKLHGTTIEAQHFCHHHKLLPGWSGPPAKPGGPKWDLSASIARDLDEQHYAASVAAAKTGSAAAAKKN
jgi:NAD(P)-dependent dehydrogenase (short-subunit alcohol dehydrogenase family)